MTQEGFGDVWDALIEAIDEGDGERAKRLAHSLRRNPPKEPPSPEMRKRTGNPDFVNEVMLWGTVGLFVLSAIFLFLDFWDKRSRAKQRSEPVAIA